MTAPAPDDPLDAVARLLHEGWAQFQRERGVRPGPERIDETVTSDRSRWTHPHLVPWEDKSPGDRNQDRFEAALR